MRRCAALLVLLLAGCTKDSSAPSPPAEPTRPPDPGDAVAPPIVDVAVPPHVVRGPVVAISDTAILVGGETIVPLEGGVVPAAQKEAGALGMKIPKLTAALARAATTATPAPVAADKVFHIVASPKTRYRILVEVIMSASDAGYLRPMVVVMDRSGTRGDIEITLPRHAPADPAGGGLAAEIEAVKSGTAPPEPPPDRPLGMVVSVAHDELLLWSITGLEGTIKKPGVALPARATSPTFELDRVAGALEAVVDRRWPSTRPEGADSIIFMAEADTPVQIVAEVLATVRARRDGRPLFPTIQLSVAGFD